MNEFENNAYFWQKLESLYATSDLEIIANEGDKVKKLSSLKFPCDFGELKTFKDDAPISYCFKGEKNNIRGLIIGANIIEKKMHIYLLVGTNDVQEEKILELINRENDEKTILVRKGDSVPSWALAE